MPRAIVFAVLALSAAVLAAVSASSAPASKPTKPKPKDSESDENPAPSPAPSPSPSPAPSPSPSPFAPFPSPSPSPSPFPSPSPSPAPSAILPFDPSTLPRRNSPGVSTPIQVSPSPAPSARAGIVSPRPRTAPVDPLEAILPTLSASARAYVEKTRLVASSYRDLLAAGGGVVPSDLVRKIRSIASDRLPWAPGAPVYNEMADAPSARWGVFVEDLRKNTLAYAPSAVPFLGDDLCALPLASRVLDSARAASYLPCPGTDR